MDTTSKNVLLNNGVEMPLIGLGTWNLRGNECIESIKKAISLGYRMIDTAQMYKNESEVGKGISESGISRDKLFVTTKIYRISNSYEKAKKAIDASLKELGLEYVDLLLLHEPYKEGPQMYQAMEEALLAGKVRAIGISNYNEEWYKGFIKQIQMIPAVNQLEANVYYQKWDYQKVLEESGTKVQAWAPLAQGIAHIAENEILYQIGNDYGKSAAQVALRFLVQRGISVIPKTRHESRLKENLDIMGFELSENNMEAIMSLDRNDTLFPWTKQF